MKSYCFDTDDAVNYGVDEAIILHNLKYWISHNIANRKNLHDGRTWTYNSLPAFHEIFPFWSERQLDRIIRSLLKSGVIVSGNYNKVGYDRTKWYALENEDSLKSTISPNGEIEITKRGDRKHRTVRPIPDINTDINTTTRRDRSFDDFWPFYPKKVAKQAALKAWNKLSPENKEKAFLDIPTRYTQDEDKQFIPNPASWLNGHRWEDHHIEKPRTGAQILMDNIGQNYERTESTHDNRQPALGDQRNLGQQVLSASAGSPAYHSAALDEDSSPFHS